MSDLLPTQLRCEHLACPRGLNTQTPRFNWVLSGNAGYATAWRIVAGYNRHEVAEGVGSLWDSDLCDMPECLPVHWRANELPRDVKVWWSVQVRDEQGQLSRFASPAAIYTGLDEGAWTAEWIGRYFVLPAGREVPQDTSYDNRFQARPADYLRRTFNTEQPERAFVYVTALGLYELYLNGIRIGEDVMAPGWTDYHTRVEYQVHDVTELVDGGENVLGAILGEGWYSGRIGHNQRRAGNHYGGRPALMCQLHLEYADGTIERVVSDAQWQTRQGPICYSDFLMGEMYDARLALCGWSEAGSGIENWQPVEVFTPDPQAPLRDAARANPVRELARFTPESENIAPDGERVFDFGQNIAGYGELEIDAPAGTEIRLRHAERLADDGALYTQNLRFAVSEDIYICKGGGRESYKPRFTFHGFQYIGLTASGPFSHLSLEAIAIGTDLPICSKIETGNPLVNQLLSNIIWSQRGNFLAVPTDCPQRDERYGWTADAQVFWRTAGYFMDVAAFTEKWMLDLADGQSEEGVYPDVAPTKPLNPYRLTPQPGAPAWGDAPVILAWDHWCRYADKTLIVSHWSRLVAWMDVIERNNPSGIRTEFVNNNYGDWLSVGAETDRALINTAYWIRLADLMAQLASVIEENSTPWTDLSERLRHAFAARFLSKDGKLSGDTQTAYLLALDFRLLPITLESESESESAIVLAGHLQRLLDTSDGHLQTGFLGVRHLAPVISDWIGPERAVDLLLRESYPSWGFSIRNGATTIWERWDGWTPENGFQSKSMNSFNHYAYGAIGEWIWARLAGIDWDESNAGFNVVKMRPIFDPRIGHVTAEYNSPVGKVCSAWHYIDSHTVNWHIELAPGTSAEVILPEGWSTGVNTGVSTTMNTGMRAGFSLAAGHHDLSLVRCD